MTKNNAIGSLEPKLDERTSTDIFGAFLNQDYSRTVESLNKSVPYQNIARDFGSRDIYTRFMNKVCFGATSCWYWRGNVRAGGYGSINALGENKAHRVSYRLFKGEIPIGMKILHSCDLPGCVNPEHLSIGTQAENVADMVAKGRQRGSSRPGAKNPMAKLKSKDIEIIRSLAAKGCMQKDIAESFVVSPMTISRAVRGETWK